MTGAPTGASRRALTRLLAGATVVAAATLALGSCGDDDPVATGTDPGTTPTTVTASTSTTAAPADSTATSTAGPPAGSLEAYALGSWRCSMVSSDPDDPDQGAFDLVVEPGRMTATFDVGYVFAGRWTLDGTDLTVVTASQTFTFHDLEPGATQIRYDPDVAGEAGTVAVESRPDAISFTWAQATTTNRIACERDE